MTDSMMPNFSISHNRPGKDRILSRQKLFCMQIFILIGVELLLFLNNSAHSETFQLFTLTFYSTAMSVKGFNFDHYRLRH